MVYNLCRRRAEAKRTICQDQAFRLRYSRTDSALFTIYTRNVFTRLDEHERLFPLLTDLE